MNAEERTKPIRERMIREARVAIALRRHDLDLILWATRGESRTRVLEALLAGELTAPQIIQRTGVPQCSVYRVLEELMGAGIVVIVGEIRGREGPRSRIYKLASGEDPAMAGICDHIEMVAEEEM